MRGSAALAAIRAIMAGASREAAGAGSDGDSLRALAPHLFILDLAQGHPVYRLAGSAARAMAGSAARAMAGGDPRGRSYYANWSADAHPALQSFFDAAAKTACAFHVFSDVPRAWGVAARYETVLIPVTAALPGSHGFVGVSILLEGDADGGRPAGLQHLRRIAFLHGGRPAPCRLFPRPV